MKIKYQFPGGPEVAGDVTKRPGLLVIHKAPRKGYCVTEVATGLLVAWRKGNKEARDLRRALEAAPRDEWEKIAAHAPRGGEIEAPEVIPVA